LQLLIYDPGMHKLLLALFLTLAACAKSQQHPNQAGRLQNSSIDEASGLARSNIDPGRLWIVNDGGSGPVLYAIGLDGSDLGAFHVSGADNQDWEDLSSFVLDDQPMLLIADFGDNLGTRESATLYVLQEPEVNNMTNDEAVSLVVSWQIEFTFPDGAIDAESVSVDVENETVLILSKREIPAVLYEVPLRRGAEDTNTPVTATIIGPVTSLPQPSKLDRDRALAHLDWHWQPTAMDFSPAADSAAILTYRGLYFYDRAENQSWYDALQSEPAAIKSKAFNKAESVTFSTDGSAVFVTSEQANAPLLRFDVE
jgi:hypothetical protein